MIDIDDFKKINDNYGHIFGDIVLKKLSSLLKKETTEKKATIARYGGEEFVIAITNITPDEITAIAKNLRQVVEKTGIAFRRKKIHFTISLGTALFPNDKVSAIELINKADARLLIAKRKGKNQVCSHF